MTFNHLGPYSQNILPFKEKLLKITGMSVLILRLLNVCSKIISQSILTLKPAPKSEKLGVVERTYRQKSVAKRPLSYNRRGD